jgi:hypothetical protein
MTPQNSEAPAALDTAERAMKEIADMTDAEFDAAYGGRELLPIEQAIYEAEGAERFALLHGRGRKSDKARAESWGVFDKTEEPA